MSPNLAETESSLKLVSDIIASPEGPLVVQHDDISPSVSKKTAVAVSHAASFLEFSGAVIMMARLNNLCLLEKILIQLPRAGGDFQPGANA